MNKVGEIGLYALEIILRVIVFCAALVMGIVYICAVAMHLTNPCANEVRK